MGIRVQLICITIHCVSLSFLMRCYCYRYCVVAVVVVVVLVVDDTVRTCGRSCAIRLNNVYDRGVCWHREEFSVDIGLLMVHLERQECKSLCSDRSVVFTFHFDYMHMIYSCDVHLVRGRLH